VLGFQVSVNLDRKAFPGIFIQDGQHPDRPSVTGSFGYKVIAPHMIGSLGPESDTGTVRKPEPSPFRLFLGHFQAFFLPDPFHPLMVDSPTIVPEHVRDLPVAVASVLTRQPYNLLRQGLFIIPKNRSPSLCCSWLA